MPEQCFIQNWDDLGNSELRCKVAASVVAPCPVCYSVTDSCGWILWDQWPIDSNQWRPKHFLLNAPPEFIEAFIAIACRNKWRGVLSYVTLFYAEDLDALVSSREK